MKHNYKRKTLGFLKEKCQNGGTKSEIRFKETAIKDTSIPNAIVILQTRHVLCTCN